MGILDGGKSEQIKYLDDERKKIWDRLVKIENHVRTLETELTRRTPEAEKVAKEHSKKASEYRNKVQQRMEEASELVEKLNKQLEHAIATREQTELTANKIFEIKGNIDILKVGIDLSDQEFREHVVSVEKRIALIDEVYEKYPDLEEALETLDTTIQKIDENLKKSNLTLSSINSRKTEIDDIHREIFGYIDKNDTEKEIKIEGLKSKLDNTYERLEDEISDAQSLIESVKTEYMKNYSDFEKNHKKLYEEIQNEIRKLLPNALTAGLSSAFSKKKDDEVAASAQLQKRFIHGIYILIGISFIPVIVSIIFLVQKESLAEVILRLPRLVLAIVPMYIPALWITYSASKKLNLSKRLIEEYAHKEVLSRTYEGLSNQISNIHDQNQSEELKIRLLTNFLQASSENPGKLISNYETSDHPIMEALEQSYKLQIAVEKLADIPGLGKVVAILEKGARNKLEKKTEKIEKLLDDTNKSDL